MATAKEETQDMMNDAELVEFVRESNRIEGILREPTTHEVNSHFVFLRLRTITINMMQDFVALIQPGAVLRDRHGLDVRVGNHTPIPGSPYVREQLQDLLERTNRRTKPNGVPTPYAAHQQYEHLHPFMDGNGRSGRALWLWMMEGKAPLGFLHTWYYQSLQGVR